MTIPIQWAVFAAGLIAILAGQWWLLHARHDRDLRRGTALASVGLAVALVAALLGSLR